MKLLTRDEVRHAYKPYVEENYERDSTLRLYWDSEREWNEDALGFTDEPWLAVMVHQDIDGGITIHQELMNERAEVSFPQDVELRWLMDNSARIEPGIRIERERDSRKSPSDRWNYRGHQGVQTKSRAGQTGSRIADDINIQ